MTRYEMQVVESATRHRELCREIMAAIECNRKSGTTTALSMLLGDEAAVVINSRQDAAEKIGVPRKQRASLGSMNRLRGKGGRKLFFDTDAVYELASRTESMVSRLLVELYSKEHTDDQG